MSKKYSLERAEAQVNFGMIRSLIGFVSQHNKDWGAIMHNQVHHQARKQGLDCEMGWDEAVETHMSLSVPVMVVVDIAELIMRAKRDMDEIGENRQTVMDAIHALHETWNPLVKASMISVYNAHSQKSQDGSPGFLPGDRFGNIPPESLN
tara:strand:+ start:7169 stop:7618 length:450 start_codon:yes stop_codon:yes gene_type:complete